MNVYQGKTTTSMSVSAVSGTCGGTTNLSATLTPGVLGRMVTFTPSGSTTTNGSGGASVSNVSLSGIAAGTYPAGVSATVHW